MNRDPNMYFSPPSVVEVRGVGVALQRQQILRGIDFDVPQGQTLAIIGESGCGKTVLLKTIIGLIKPTAGAALFNGADLSSLPEKELAQQRLRLGYLFQSAALFDSLTVGQNVAFPLRQQGGREDAEIRQIVIARLHDVGLPPGVVGKKPAELSGGMRKRVGLARALATAPEMMLYDEPTTGLDPVMSDVINQLIIRTRQRHQVTSIVVTHDMHTVRRIADRVVMVYPLTRLGAEDPQIIFDGRPEELEESGDRRVTQFVRGEAGERLSELQEGA